MFITSILTMVQLHSYTYTYRIISTENRHVYVSEGDFPERKICLVIGISMYHRFVGRK